MDTVNYKCPNCSAGLAFDSKSQKMKCEYCGNAYSLEELEQLAEQQDTVKKIRRLTGRDLSRNSGSQMKNQTWRCGAVRPAELRCLRKRQQVQLFVRTVIIR